MGEKGYATNQWSRVCTGSIQQRAAGRGLFIKTTAKILHKVLRDNYIKKINPVTITFEGKF